MDGPWIFQNGASDLHKCSRRSLRGTGVALRRMNSLNEITVKDKLCQIAIIINSYSIVFLFQLVVNYIVFLHYVDHVQRCLCVCLCFSLNNISKYLLAYNADFNYYKLQVTIWSLQDKNWSYTMCCVSCKNSRHMIDAFYLTLNLQHLVHREATEGCNMKLSSTLRKFSRR